MRLPAGEERRHGSHDALQGLPKRLLDAMQELTSTEIHRLSSGVTADDVRAQARTLVKRLTKGVTKPDDDA